MADAVRTMSLLKAVKDKGVPLTIEAPALHLHGAKKQHETTWNNSHNHVILVWVSKFCSVQRFTHVCRCLHMFVHWTCLYTCACLYVHMCKFTVWALLSGQLNTVMTNVKEVENIGSLSPFPCVSMHVSRAIAYVPVTCFCNAYVCTYLAGVPPAIRRFAARSWQSAIRGSNPPCFGHSAAMNDL